MCKESAIEKWQNLSTVERSQVIELIEELINLEEHTIEQFKASVINQKTINTTGELPVLGVGAIVGAGDDDIQRFSCKECETIFNISNDENIEAIEQILEHIFDKHIPTLTGNAIDTSTSHLEKEDSEKSDDHTIDNIPHVILIDSEYVRDTQVCINPENTDDFHNEDNWYDWNGAAFVAIKEGPVNAKNHWSKIMNDEPKITHVRLETNHLSKELVDQLKANFEILGDLTPEKPYSEFVMIDADMEVFEDLSVYIGTHVRSFENGWYIINFDVYGQEDGGQYEYPLEDEEDEDDDPNVIKKCWACGNEFDEKENEHAMSLCIGKVRDEKFEHVEMEPQVVCEKCLKEVDNTLNSILKKNTIPTNKEVVT